MDCNNCGEKMIRLKYLHQDELDTYLMNDYIPNEVKNYKVWLMSLNENDLIITYFQREDYRDIKEKYYLRRIEKKTKNGIKLKGLSSIFKYEEGEIIYEKKDRIFPSKTTYKIHPINEQVDKIIRDYCKNEEEFDIDKLNNLITKELCTKVGRTETVSVSK